MKWKSDSTEFIPEKTFLVIKDDLEALGRKGKYPGKVKTQNTGTWPPKMKRSAPLYEEQERPKTANLEKPSILDPKLVDKLDMSLLSKELLCRSMTHFRLSKATSGGRLSYPSSSRCRQNVTVGDQQRWNSTSVSSTAWSPDSSMHLQQKRPSFDQILMDTRLCRLEPAVESPRIRKQARGIAQDCVLKKQSTDIRRLDDNNNRNRIFAKISSLNNVKKKNARPAITSDLEVFTASSNKIAPEPCKTCGRSDQPERFHSHPRGSQVKIIKESPTKTKIALVPKSIQKPVALNFRSDKSRSKIEETTSFLQEIRIKTPRPNSAPMKRGPRTITCYICAREFGTASFPIHEPTCMQKWERENNTLPVNQRRATPQRPEVAIDNSRWNEAAWEESQAQLLPCLKCGRTFLPNRLPIHQRSCKATPKNQPQNLEPQKWEGSILEKHSSSGTRMCPPMVSCKICGRNFGSRSILIHEPQCIKRSEIEKEGRSMNQRKTESIYRRKSIEERENFARDAFRRKRITCNICGRNFGSTGLAFHEPQCLKKWRIENEKLPASQRRKEMEKPDIIYSHDPETGSTTIDIDALAEASWKSHLSQLVACKNCRRTFNPDRVSVHEQSCKANNRFDCLKK